MNNRLLKCMLVAALIGSSVHAMQNSAEQVEVENTQKSIGTIKDALLLIPWPIKQMKLFATNQISKNFFSDMHQHVKKNVCVVAQEVTKLKAPVLEKLEPAHNDFAEAISHFNAAVDALSDAKDIRAIGNFDACANDVTNRCKTYRDILRSNALVQKCDASIDTNDLQDWIALPNQEKINAFKKVVTQAADVAAQKLKEKRSVAKKARHAAARQAAHEQAMRMQKEKQQQLAQAQINDKQKRDQKKNEKNQQRAQEQFKKKEALAYAGRSAWNRSLNQGFVQAQKIQTAKQENVSAQMQVEQQKKPEQAAVQVSNAAPKKVARKKIVSESLKERNAILERIHNQAQTLLNKLQNPSSDEELVIKQTKVCSQDLLPFIQGKKNCEYYDVLTGTLDSVDGLEKSNAVLLIMNILAITRNIKAAKNDREVAQRIEQAFDQTDDLANNLLDMLCSPEQSDRIKHIREVLGRLEIIKEKITQKKSTKTLTDLMECIKLGNELHACSKDQSDAVAVFLSTFKKAAADGLKKPYTFDGKVVDLFCKKSLDLIDSIKIQLDQQLHAISVSMQSVMADMQSADNSKQCTQSSHDETEEQNELKGKAEFERFRAAFSEDDVQAIVNKVKILKKVKKMKTQDMQATLNFLYEIMIQKPLYSLENQKKASKNIFEPLQEKLSALIAYENKKSIMTDEQAKHACVSVCQGIELLLNNVHDHASNSLNFYKEVKEHEAARAV